MQCHMADHVLRNVGQSVRSSAMHAGFPEATNFGMQGTILPAAGGTGWVQARHEEQRVCLWNADV